MQAWRSISQAVRRDRAEDGQVLVLFVAGLVGFLALLALSVDVGLMVFTRTDLQKTADAAALAGAQDLPNVITAESVARDYVVANHDSADAEVEFSNTGTSINVIRVEVRHNVDLFFGGFVGVNNADISAEATVELTSYTGGSGLLPWGLVASANSNSTLLLNQCFDGWYANGEPKFKQNQSCEIKFGAGESSGGDFGALALDGTGANTYRDSIEHGTTGTFRKGDMVEPETGNMSGPTRQGIDNRFSQSVPPGCPGHDRDDVLVTSDDGSVSIRTGCEESPRIGIIPVVDKIDNPEKSEILGFAYVYLVDQVPGQGQNSTVEVEFVEFTTAIPGGEYGGDNLDGTIALRMTE